MYMSDENYSCMVLEFLIIYIECTNISSHRRKGNQYTLMYQMYQNVKSYSVYGYTVNKISNDQ